MIDSGRGRVPEAGAERRSCQDPARQVRALGDDRRQDDQSPRRRDGYGPDRRYPAKH